MAGEVVASLHLDDHGAAGDRSHAVLDTFKGAPRRVNAEQLPRLLAWSAAYPADAPAREEPVPVVTAPDGRARAWDDPALPAALADDVGRPVTLARDLYGVHIDRRGTVHITVEASVAALATALGADVDVRRFRSNIHLELDAEPFAEEGWVGRRLRIGTAEAEVVERCERCPVPGLDPQTQAKWPALLRALANEHSWDFGLIVRVTEPVAVHGGDRVELLA